MFIQCKELGLRVTTETFAESLKPLCFFFFLSLPSLQLLVTMTMECHICLRSFKYVFSPSLSIRLYDSLIILKPDHWNYYTIFFLTSVSFPSYQPATEWLDWCKIEMWPHQPFSLLKKLFSLPTPSHPRLHVLLWKSSSCISPSESTFTFGFRSTEYLSDFCLPSFAHWLLNLPCP